MNDIRCACCGHYPQEGELLIQYEDADGKHWLCSPCYDAVVELEIAIPYRYLDQPAAGELGKAHE